LETSKAVEAWSSKVRALTGGFFSLNSRFSSEWQELLWLCGAWKVCGLKEFFRGCFYSDLHGGAAATVATILLQWSGIKTQARFISTFGAELSFLFDQNKFSHVGYMFSLAQTGSTSTEKRAYARMNRFPLQLLLIILPSSFNQGACRSRRFPAISLN
jgi:hypothetical protein